MADMTILPTWAANHIREHLLDHTHIINAVPAGNGYLLNTSRGAVLLERRRGREPRHWFLPLPATHATITCTKCEQRMEFVKAEDASIFCTHCGTKNKLGK